MTESNNFYINKVAETVDNFKFNRITAKDGVSALEALIYLTQHKSVDTIILIQSVYEMFKKVSNEV